MENGSRKEAIAPAATTTATSNSTSASSAYRDIFPIRLGSRSQHFLHLPPNHKAEIANKLMLILTHFKITELLKNIFKKIQLLG